MKQEIAEHQVCIIIEKQYRETLFFYGWNTAKERLKEIAEIKEFTLNK